MFNYERGYDSIDRDYEEICRDEYFAIKDPKEAVFALIEEIFEGVTFNEFRASHALQRLAKVYNIDVKDIDFDHPNCTTIQQIQAEKHKGENLLKDYKKAVTRHLNMLKQEIYGEGDLDYNTINGAISNVEWLCDQEITEKKVKVRRA